MVNQRFTIKVIAATLALTFGFSAQAAANRTFVATTGNDSNVSLNCGPTAFCRTFTAALSVTTSGGEIVVVDSGGYGPANISQPVVITAVGIAASITATTLNALTINTSGNVTITGLNLYGSGTALDGVNVVAVGVLHLYNMQIQNFASAGIEFGSSGENLYLSDSKISNCANYGLYVTGGQAMVHNAVFDHNGLAGANGIAGFMTVDNSSALYNNVGFHASGGTVSLFHVQAVFNQHGVEADGSGNLYFADSAIGGNVDSYLIMSGGTASGSNPGTILIVPGQLSSGALGAAIALK